MDQGDELDLGNGVRVVAEAAGTLVVWAEDLDLGWRVRSAKLPGTAVDWRGDLLEVVDRSGGGQVARWQLRPWDEAATIRLVEKLDAEEVARWAGERDLGRHESRLRLWMVVAIPVLGFAPGWLQADWQRRLGYPAMAAVVVTSLMELVAGWVGIIQSLTAGLGGGFWLPWWLSWLVVIGPLMGIEGLIRLQYGIAHGEPLGSALSLPVHLFLKAPAPPTPPEPSGPSIQDFDGEAGTLEITSPCQRRDWDGGGILPYRGRWFFRVATEKLGAGWLYRFEEVLEGTEEGMEVLRLMAPPQRPESPVELDRGAGGWLSLTVRTALFCFASGPLQSQWARRVGGSAASFTVVGAGMEIFGGLVNLLLGGTASPVALLDIVVAGEGVVRLGALMWTGRPVGSVPGLILGPVYERWLSS